MVHNKREVCQTTCYLYTSSFNDDTVKIYASSMPPSMQPFETVILLAAITGCIIPILLSHLYDSQAYMLLESLDQSVSWIDRYENGACYPSMVQETNPMLFVPRQGEEYL
jgi:hypothetical protein